MSASRPDFNSVVGNAIREGDAARASEIRQQASCGLSERLVWLSRQKTVPGIRELETLFESEIRRGKSAAGFRLNPLLSFIVAVVLVLTGFVGGRFSHSSSSFMSELVRHNGNVEAWCSAGGRVSIPVKGVMTPACVLLVPGGRDDKLH